MKRGKRISKWLLLVVFWWFVALVVLEIMYRYQIVDFYRTELKALNPEQASKPVVLVFGDSFTAQPDSYLEQGREEGQPLVNAAIPGTCALQVNYVASRRLKTFAPQTVVFQVYVGNDLIDVDYPVNWEVIDFKRNLYWVLARRFRCLAALNYKFGQLSQAADEESLESTLTKNQLPFSAEHYSPRTRMYLRANPEYLNHSIHLTGGFDVSMDILVEAYREVVERLPTSTRYYFLVVPHCTQVSPRYHDQYVEMGARLAPASLKENDPFIDRLTQAFGEEHIINPLVELRVAEQQGTPCYFSNDPHMTHQGHAVLKQVLQNKLEENN